MKIVQHLAEFDVPREKVLQYFSRGTLSFSRDTHLCFVCGAAGNTIPGESKPSLRAKFIAYVDTLPEPRLICVRAETAATELLRQLDERGQNISAFEKTIASSVHSVLIFPESPGSFAELGYFSAYDDVSKKTLVAVWNEHQNSSFLMLGPIHRISHISQYSPQPFVHSTGDDGEMGTLLARLLGESLKRKAYRERFSKKEWADYTDQQQLAILDELISIHAAATEEDVRHSVRLCFGRYDISKIRLQFSILVATGRVARNDDGDLFALERKVAFMDGDVPGREAAQLAWRMALDAHDPDAILQLEAMRNG